ncbi:MAG: HAD family hydrolase [Chloroflexi bacterium]|nr:HAD family hydrolase [Chloroflexota bacterium]
MLPKAILFDMDDTILTWDAVAEQAWGKACRISAGKTKLFKSEELFSLINDIREWYYSDPERHRVGRLNLYDSRRTTVKLALEKLGCDDARIADEVAASYGNLKEQITGFFPDAEDTLRELISRGIVLALVTNGEAKTQRAKIERFGLSRYFSVCLIEGELSYGKPESRMFEAALIRLKATPEQSWMVGDDLSYDIAGAQKLGIFSVWHDYGKKGLPENSEVKPDRIVNNISEVLSL